MEQEIYILVGGIGTGKSTYAKKLKREQGLNILCPDKIEEQYQNCSENEIDKIIDRELKNYLNSGESFILDGKCLTRRERIDIINRANQNGYVVYGYDFGVGNIVSLLNRLRQPRGQPRKRWEAVYEDEKHLYEPPELKEGFERIYYPIFFNLITK